MSQRVIKFRGWNKSSKLMVDSIKLVTLKDTFELNEAFKEDMVILPLQFTGLLDKNGKEIYEGDVFDMFKNNLKSVVVWYKSGWYVKTASKTGNSYYMLHQRNRWNEVIGNIYGNPELLK